MAELIAGAAGRIGEALTNRRETVSGADGIKRCAVCGQAVEIKLPAMLGMDGRTVRCACACDAAEIAREDKRRAREEAARRVAEIGKISMMDARMRASTFDQWTGAERARTICTRYADSWDRMRKENQGLLIWGPPGTGKTFAAACIANALIARGIPVIMTSMVRLTGLNNGEETDEIIRRTNSAELMVIDDLGAERDTSTAQERVYAVLDSRYRSGKPLILTTNLTGEELATGQDARLNRVYDRILETCYPVLITGPSRRREAGAERHKRMKRVLEGTE